MPLGSFISLSLVASKICVTFLLTLFILLNFSMHDYQIFGLSNTVPRTRRLQDFRPSLLLSGLYNANGSRRIELRVSGNEWWIGGSFTALSTLKHNQNGPSLKWAMAYLKWTLLTRASFPDAQPLPEVFRRLWLPAKEKWVKKKLDTPRFIIHACTYATQFLVTCFSRFRSNQHCTCRDKFLGFC